MTETDKLVERINAACNGHPHAKIAWPHRLLHDARDTITAQTKEIERLRGIVSASEAHRIKAGSELVDRALAAERERDEALGAARRGGCGAVAGMRHHHQGRDAGEQALHDAFAALRLTAAVVACIPIACVGLAAMCLSWPAGHVVRWCERAIDKIMEAA